MKTAIFTLMVILATFAGCTTQNDNLDNITNMTENITDNIQNLTNNTTNITNVSDNIIDEIENITENITGNVTYNDANDTIDNQSILNRDNDFLEIVGNSNGLEIEVMDVNYYGNISGYLARPDNNETYPGVVMIHEWWGLNDNIRNVAETLASYGYIVLAVDLYNGTVTSDPQEALQLSTETNGTVENMKSAIDYLEREENVTGTASFGLCFGGARSAELSLSDASLDATVIYYGEIPQGNISDMDGPVLGVFAQDDEAVSIGTVNGFEEALNESGIENEIYIYEGLGHAFANPNSENFAREETRDAWNKTIDFLDTNLK